MEDLEIAIAEFESVYLKNQGMDVRVYSLALVLNVLFVMPGNCE